MSISGMIRRSGLQDHEIVECARRAGQRISVTTVNQLRHNAPGRGDGLPSWRVTNALAAALDEPVAVIVMAFAERANEVPIGMTDKTRRAYEQLTKPKPAKVTAQVAATPRRPRKGA